MRWLTQVALIIVVLAATAAPATAKKDQNPDLYDVTLNLIVGQDGLATQCPAPLVMTESGGRHGRVLGANGDTGSSEPDLFLRFPSMDEDCYTGLAAGNTDGPRLFAMYFTRSGELEHIDWHFAVETVQVTNKKGKPTGFKVTDKFWLQSLDDLSWNSGVVSGTFLLQRYESDTWNSLGAAWLTFGMTVEPQT